uniref:ribosomal protein S13 n=1 Tax=Meringosphaera mediterranea TaxID=2837474 RepID=UPI00286CA700|nr:ribosomal protein S13 [Meringosphaera mediterranea]WLD05715.1 ribosomal protein S13 [Meringosphaera mediterranea]WLD05875.1 ribosomal protein S13 [Meringosphaera mediterranea]
MVRIAGVDLPRGKRVEYALTKIFGIGLVSSQKILETTNVDPNTRTVELSDEQVSNIREAIESGYQVEGDLRRSTSLNIKRLSEINCVRGQRHRKSLPVRGQRTRTNARARRGSKKTVAGKKK